MTTTPTAALVEEAEKITEGVPADWTACSCNKCGLVWALGEMHIATVELETGESDCAQPSPEQRRRIMDFMARSRSMIPELATALRRAEADRDEARRDAEAVRAAAGYLTEETQQMAHLRASVAGQQKRAEQAIAERDELRATVTRLNRRAQTAEAGVRDNVEACKAAGKSMGRTLANAAAAMNLRRAEKAEAERNAQHAEVLRLTGELRQSRKESLERARTVLMLDEDLDEACALGFGLGCMLTNTQWRERDAAERAQRGLKLMQSCLQDEERKLSELTATRDLLTDENARLQKERDEAREQLERIANPPIKRLHVENGEMDIVLDAPEMASIIATVFYDALDEHKAENYLEMTCAKPESPQKRVVITVRKTLGKTPDEMRKKAERELAEARAHIATLELLRRGGK